MVFAGVVRSLPVDQQVPTKILEGMGQWGWGLTRANIASHLQKFRHRQGRVPGKWGRECPCASSRSCSGKRDECEVSSTLRSAAEGRTVPF